MPIHRNTRFPLIIYGYIILVKTCVSYFYIHVRSCRCTTNTCRVQLLLYRSGLRSVAYTKRFLDICFNFFLYRRNIVGCRCSVHIIDVNRVGRADYVINTNYPVGPAGNLWKIMRTPSRLLKYLIC